MNFFYGLTKLPYFNFSNSHIGRGMVFSQRFYVVQTIFVNNFHKQYGRQFSLGRFVIGYFFPGATFRRSCQRYNKIILSRDNLTGREILSD